MTLQENEIDSIQKISSEYDGKYVSFAYLGPSKTGKTERWAVHAKDGKHDLGSIAWLGRWRKYSFFPAEQTVFEQQCLFDISNFLVALNQRHRESK